MNCLLCYSTHTHEVWRHTGGEVRRLFQEAGHSITDQAYGKVTSDHPVTLFHCDACGFEFFDPALAGSAEFYEELDRGTYYPQERPEFAFALRHLTAHGAQSVLDVGGGQGAFLDLARSRNIATSGFELNQTAAAAARAKGHAMLSGEVEDIPTALPNAGVDGITLFHVLEHLPDFHEFIKKILKGLRPGGLMIISVPNRNSIYKLLPLDPANLPPHHITRWRAKDLRRLGSMHGLTCIQTSADILYGRGIASFWHLQNRLAKAIGQKELPGGRWLPEVLSFFYRKLGLRYVFPRWGLSVYAAFQKDADHES